MRIHLVGINSVSTTHSYTLTFFLCRVPKSHESPYIHKETRNIHIRDMADHLDDKGIRGGERAHNQASTTTNIFNWRSALKKEVTAFIKQ